MITGVSRHLTTTRHNYMLDLEIMTYNLSEKKAVKDQPTGNDSIMS